MKYQKLEDYTYIHNQQVFEVNYLATLMDSCSTRSDDISLAFAKDRAIFSVKDLFLRIQN